MPNWVASGLSKVVDVSFFFSKKEKFSRKGKVSNYSHNSKKEN